MSDDHPQTSTSNLQQPIAIPATSAALGSPFLRAYPLELEAYGVPPPDFLSFIDELNRLMVVSPPVRVLGLAGDIVGLVPLATAQIVGGAVSAAAALTTVAMSKGRSELFIRESNKKLFAPRGLKANIVKLEVVAKVAGIPILDAAGKMTKDAKLLRPIENLETDLSGQQRRLVALAPWTSPLELCPSEHQDVPDNAIDKMHAYTSERQRASEEKKILKKRTKAQEDRMKDSDKIRKVYEKEIDKLAEEEEKVKRKEEKKPKKVKRELGKLEEKRSKVETEYDKEMTKLNEGSVKKDKEEAAMRKILWLMIQRQGDAMVSYQDVA